MAMLAGPRRKQKVINLRAKNSAWSNDNDKFGQRMLEKMGWTTGKGLGAKEDGIVEHVVARYKNDERGLGFEDKNDQWTKHEDDFNALLSNLSNGDNDEEKLHSGVSLEAKSKKSKARVHYHKFTRGKDLSRYSEKDLANIFGKKSFKNLEQTEDQPQEPSDSTEKIFTEKGSMEDYFKNKLAALKSKSNIQVSENIINRDENADCGFRGFSGAGTAEDETDNVYQGFGFQSFSLNTDDSNGIICNKNTENEETQEDNVSKKKKKKKQKKQESELLSSEEISENITVKKDKKRKQGNTDLTHEAEEVINPIKTNKKKKQRVEVEVENQEVIEKVDEIVENVPKKKKKRKNKNEN